MKNDKVPHFTQNKLLLLENKAESTSNELWKGNLPWELEKKDGSVRAILTGTLIE